MLEITTRVGCSLNCRFCPQRLFVSSYGTDRETVMSLATFRACIDKVPCAEEVVFSGFSEPWLNPDCTQMLEYAAGRGHPLEVFTTLVGMDDADYSALVRIAPCTLCMHIPDAENNARFPEDERFWQILEQALQDVARGVLRVTSFSCHGTLHPRIRAAVEATGVEVITEMHDRAGNLAPDAVRARKRPLRGRVVCTRCGGDSLDRNVLLPDGTVVLCCMDFALAHPLGNLLRQTLEEIRGGEPMQECLARLSSPAAGPLLCRNCISCKPRWQWRFYRWLLERNLLGRKV